MASDSQQFLTGDNLEREGWNRVGNQYRKSGRQCLPLYEAKMCEAFNHRAASVVLSKTAMIRQGQPERTSPDQLADPAFSPMPRFWVEADYVQEAVPADWPKEWLIGWRDITSATNERTLISTVIPLSAVGDTYLLMFPMDVSAQLAGCLVASLNSYVVDYCTRQKLGGLHLKYHVFKQIPVIRPEKFRDTRIFALGPSSLEKWIGLRALELIFTAYDLATFGAAWTGMKRPFKWQETRRFLIRCEIDALFFHIYEINREDAAYIMDSFSIVRRKDEEKFGTFRTKDTILEIYDEIAEAVRTGAHYETRMRPPPADPSVAHMAP